MLVRQLIPSVALSALVLISSALSAQTKVVVIPLGDSPSTPVQNVITVAKSGGDFDDPREALESIDGSGSHLVVIAPGTYEVDGPIMIGDNVDVVGSGVNSTVITGKIVVSNLLDSDQASIFVAGNNSSLSHLTVVNNPDAGSANFVTIGVSAQNADFQIHHVNINVFSPNSGVYARGLQAGEFPSSFKKVDASHLRIRVFGGSADGVRTFGPNFRFTMSDSTIEADSFAVPASTYGIFNSAGASLRLNNTVVGTSSNGGSGATIGLGLYDGEAFIDNVSVEAANSNGVAVEFDSEGFTRISGSNLSGFTSLTPGTSTIVRGPIFISDSFANGEINGNIYQCDFVANNNGILPASCQEP